MADSAASHSLGARAAAWSVHLYTALGLPLAYFCGDALVRGDASAFFLLATLACFIDATDGFFARRFNVKEVTPEFSGRRLDDIVDYLHFVALPMMAVPALGLVPRDLGWIVIVPLMASGYGFCQERAKTDDAFVGFPSYWNILVLYLYVLQAPQWVTVGSLLVLSAMIFIPIHYVYPSRTKLMMPVTVGAGFIWMFMVIAMSLNPTTAWARQLGWVSMAYPVYYWILSGVHHRQTQRRTAGA
jgi:phosphatidylcholine synthase